MNINTIAVEDTRDYAADATLPAPMLAALAESTDLDTLCNLANNPSIDTDTMWHLALVGRDDAVDTYHSVRWAIARRQDLFLNLDLYDEMFRDTHLEVIKKLNKNSRAAVAKIEADERAGQLVSA